MNDLIRAWRGERVCPLRPVIKVKLQQTSLVVRG